MTGRWQPTTALVRAATTAVLGAFGALVLGRPDLLALVAPLGVLAALALAQAPTERPRAEVALAHRWLHEGQATRIAVTASGGEQATLVLTPPPYVACTPASAMVAAGADPGGAIRLGLVASPRRWGTHRLGGLRLAVTSRWGGYRWGPEGLPEVTLTALPVSPTFTSTESPHPLGLIGRNPSRRGGDGSEFWAIRQFRPGDRLRRVNWRTTLRTGELHAVGTSAQEDSSVLLLVDAVTDVGASGGVDGAASSLDLTVRAAGALAAHHLRVGDRVALRVLGRSILVTGPGTGVRHQRRLHELLARTQPGWPRMLEAQRLRLRAGAGTVVLVLSPMLTPEITTLMVTLARRGLTVVAIDTLPPDALPAPAIDPRSPGRLAWRMRLVEREMLLTEVARQGVPVVAWRGPGTLDDVLHRLARRARLPREVAR